MSFLRTYLDEPRSALDLAVARVVVFGLLAVLCVQQHPVWMAGLPRDLLFPPPLAGWMLAMPIAPGPVRIAQVLTIALATLAAAGVGYGLTAPLAVIGGLYVLGVPQLWGKVGHDHHILWLAAVLAASPAADALSPTARGTPTPSIAYGRPLALMGILLGIVYLFPGLAKAQAGWQWIWSDNLQNRMYQKWAEIPGYTPTFRLDRFPIVCRLLAGATVAFELSFLPLILFRRTRLLAILGGLAFHVGSALVLGINFWHLYPCYVVLVRWPSPTPTAAGPAPWLAPDLVGSALILAALLAYPLGLSDGWPIAYYPTFAAIAQPTRTIVRLEGVRPATQRLIIREMDSSRWDRLLRYAASSNRELSVRTQRGILTLVRCLDPAANPSFRVVTESVLPQTP